MAVITWCGSGCVAHPTTDMAIVEREGNELFRVSFQELARKIIRGLPRNAAIAVDPYLLARAIAEVMAACTFRTAKGGRLLWNDYRIILARADFESVRSLQGPLERDLGEALAAEAAATGAELVGELRVSVVYDESNELRAGEGTVRVAFMPTERLPPARSGELTVRFDAAHLTGLMQAVGSTQTVIVQDSEVAATGARLRWSGGEAALVTGATFTVGRSHPGAPSPFVALTGAGPKINKQHVTISVGPGVARIGRLPSANPVHVNGDALAAGDEISVGLPAEIVLSRGELTLTLTSGSG